MEEKNQKVKLKGRFQSYLIWPLIMLILFAVMDGFIFMFSIKAGFVALAGEENFCPNITSALERAEEIIK